MQNLGLIYIKNVENVTVLLLLAREKRMLSIVLLAEEPFYGNELC